MNQISIRTLTATTNRRR